MLKNLSLTAKLSLVPAVALVGLVLYVVYTSLQLSATDSRLVLLETRSYPTLEKADAVIFQFSRVPALLNNAVAAGEPGILDEAREVLQQIDSQQQALASLLSEQRQQHQALSDWREAVRDYADNALAASTKLIDGSASFDDLRPSLDRMASDLAQAQKLGSDFRAQAYDDFQQTLVQTREANAATTRLGIILSLVLVVLVSLGAWLVIRSVMVNIRGVITSLQSIARGDGDLTQRVNVESNDEIGAMIELFNSFLDKLQRSHPPDHRGRQPAGPGFQGAVQAHPGFGRERQIAAAPHRFDNPRHPHHDRQHSGSRAALAAGIRRGQFCGAAGGHCARARRQPVDRHQ